MYYREKSTYSDRKFEGFGTQICHVSHIHGFNVFFSFLSLHALYLSQYFTSGEKCSPPLLSKASCIWFSFIYLLTPPQSDQGAILSPAELIRRWLHLSRCISHSPSPHISSVALLGAVTAVSRFPNKNRQTSFIYTARLIRRVIQGALCKRHRRKIIRRNVRRWEEKQRKAEKELGRGEK